MDDIQPYDVIVIGAGPAGLSAALVLGRCRRRVLVLDDERPRNGASPALHGFLTRDGTPPRELRALAREELKAYSSVELRIARALRVTRAGETAGFSVQTNEPRHARTRLLLLATGREDPVPEVRGFTDFYGRGVYHCPYCDGWEHRDGALVVYGGKRGSIELGLELLTWSDRVTICSDGRPEWRESDFARARGHIALVENQIDRLTAAERGAMALHFHGRAPLPCDAIFFCTACPQRSPLPEDLGCRFDDEESVLCDGHRAVGVPGLFIAGNVRGGVHLAITAAAEGAEAAIAINDELAETALRNRPR